MYVYVDSKIYIIDLEKIEKIGNIILHKIVIIKKNKK